MFSSVRQFIRSLQRSNDARKKRWLVGSSALAMTLVIVLWFAYLNVIVPVLSPRESVGIAAVVAPNRDTDESILATLGRGFSVVGQSLESGWKETSAKIAPLYDSILKQFEPTPATLSPEEAAGTPTP